MRNYGLSSKCWENWLSIWIGKSEPLSTSYHIQKEIPDGWKTLNHTRMWWTPTVLPRCLFNEGLTVLAAEWSVDSLQMSVLLGIASAAKSCLTHGYTSSQGSPHPLTEGRQEYTGLVISGQVQKILKGHSSPRAAHEVGWRHWPSMAA